MKMSRPLHVLFLCTGNSARSIIAEAILNRIGGGKFRAYSAGSQPRGELNPRTLELLKDYRYDTDGLRSKSWLEFTEPGAPMFDFILTVCDNAAGEACPIWPGRPASAHWGIPDPAEAKGTDTEIAEAFKTAHQRLLERISMFIALPLDTMDAETLKSSLRMIGSIDGATHMARGK